MNIIVDESVDYYFVQQLRNNGFSVVSISERFASLSDEAIISLSLFPPSLIITEDKDFGELVFKNQVKIFGIVLMRYHKGELETVFQRLLALLQNHTRELMNSFSVINIKKTRIRKIGL